MITNLKVQGSMEIVQPLEVGLDTVYIRSNIVKVDTEDFKGWEYDEIQYSKDEYIALIAQQSNLATDTLKANPSLETIKSLYTMNKTTKDDVFGYVKSGNITQTDYLNITGETCPELPLDVIKQNKINEMSKICEDKIINEFYSDCLGNKDSNGNLIKDHFDCTDRDQIYIQGLANKATLIINGTPTDGILDWKKSGEPVCYPFPPQACIKLGLDMFSHISDSKKRYEQIKECILTKLTTLDGVNAVTWDMIIPS